MTCGSAKPWPGCWVLPLLLTACPSVKQDPPPPPANHEILPAPAGARGALAAGTDGAPRAETVEPLVPTAPQADPDDPDAGEPESADGGTAL